MNFHYLSKSNIGFFWLLKLCWSDEKTSVRVYMYKELAVNTGVSHTEPPQSPYCPW